MNNCVGANNQKHFVLFTFYTALLSGYAILLLILRGVYFVRDPLGHTGPATVPVHTQGGVMAIAQEPHRGRYHHRSDDSDAAGRFLLMVLLFLEALLFGLFTMAVRERPASASAPRAHEPMHPPDRTRCSDAARARPTARCCVPTFQMFTEQISSILADQTGIERLKREEYGRGRDWLHNLSETFGRPFSLLWLLPTTVKYHGLTWIDMLPAECEV